MVLCRMIDPKIKGDTYFMKQFDYAITDEIGIHARPAGQLAKEAKNFQSAIKISINGKEANVTKLMAVMGLGVKKGDTVMITADGADEEEAIAAMEQFMKDNL